MFVLIIVLAAGFLALIKGADWFVEGSADLARFLHIPGLIIGLTIVAMGTSAPELAVSISAALKGSNEIALSNVVGSNIFNLLVVLGTCALFIPLSVDTITIRRDCSLSLAATVFIRVTACGKELLSGKWIHSDMSAKTGIVSRWTGVFAVLVFLTYMLVLILQALRHPGENDTIPSRPLWKCMALILVGILLIIAGGQMVVESARRIASAFGVSETLIGLTIVAVGTSLPELVTSVVAARKGEAGLAVGNVIGSNIFNILLILGVSSFIHPIGVNVASVYDLIILLFVTTLTMVFAITERSINRKEGVFMLLFYVSYMVFAGIR